MLRRNAATVPGGDVFLQAEIILETRGLTREFKGFVAVNQIDLKVRRGHIHALIGPNGAGKTTFFNLLTKFLAPSAGTIVYQGSDITAEKPAQVARRGIVRSFQISAVFPHMTVLENVRAALQRKLGTSFHFWKGERTLEPLHERARALLAEVGLQEFMDQQAVNLPYGRKRALELATTLALDPELMLLDEPTQGMGHEDVSRVTELIRKVAANRTILMVEHNMNVVASIADRITVLQRGAILADGTYAEVSSDPQVIEAYMGSADAALAGAH
jgi:branched-chain amino acid transport system ATP-binding protein